MSASLISDGAVVFFGSHAVDQYLSCAYWPVEGQKINATDAGRVYGGMIPNAASIFAGYGRAPTLMGPLQDNGDAAPILAEMAAAGVDTRLVRRSPEFQNSFAYSFLTDANPHEKTLVIVDPGYVFDLTASERQVFTRAKFIYSTIAHLRRIVDGEAVLAEARSHGAKLYIDVEAESFRSMEQDWWAFAAAHFVAFNEESLAKFRGSMPADQAIARLLAATSGEVITTLGKDGCKVTLADRCVELAGIPVAAVDPLGAGDTFNATYLHGRAAGWSVERAARFANAAAARSTTLVGPRSGRASVDEIEMFIQMQGGLVAQAQ